MSDTKVIFAHGSGSNFDPNATTGLTAGKVYFVEDANNTGYGSIYFDIPNSDGSVNKRILVSDGIALSTANKKNTNYFGVQPAAASTKSGDLFFDASNGNKISQSDGTSWTERLLGSAALADNAITTAKINNSAVTSDKLATNSVITAKITNSAVTTDKINAFAVTNAKIANSTITGSKLANYTIGASKLTITDLKEIGPNATTKATIGGFSILDNGLSYSTTDISNNVLVSSNAGFVINTDTAGARLSNSTANLSFYSSPNTTANADRKIRIGSDGLKLYQDSTIDLYNTVTDNSVYGEHTGYINGDKIYSYANGGRTVVDFATSEGHYQEIYLGGHGTEVGARVITNIKTTPALTTSWKSCGSITLTAGQWIIMARVGVSGSTTANEIRWNMSTTSASASVTYTATNASGNYLRGSCASIIGVDTTATYHLNVRLKTADSNAKLYDDAYIQAIHIR